MQFPLLHELSISNQIKFDIVKWNKYFDALIGSKDLKKMNAKLTFRNAVKYKIRTKTNKPIYVRSYRHPQNTKEEIKSQIQKLL